MPNDWEDQSGHLTKIFAENENNGSAIALAATGRGRLVADVFLQDQFTPLVNYVAHRNLGDLTLTAPAVIDTRTLTFADASTVGSGEIISILEAARWYQGMAISKTGSAVTVDTPLDYAFGTGAAVSHGSASLAEDGSGTRLFYHVKPPPAATWDITGFTVWMADNLEPDDSKFSGIAPLTLGLVMRLQNGNYHNIGNAHNNGDFIRAGCDVTYTDKAGSGLHSVRAQCPIGGQQNSGVVIRIDGSEDDTLTIINQGEDLSAINSIIVGINGHVVED